MYTTSSLLPPKDLLAFQYKAIFGPLVIHMQRARDFYIQNPTKALTFPFIYYKKLKRDFDQSLYL